MALYRDHIDMVIVGILRWDDLTIKNKSFSKRVIEFIDNNAR